MCGRYTLHTEKQALERRFRVDLGALADFEPRYNIAPTEPVLTVRRVQETRCGEMMRWGLVPAWAEEPSATAGMINARLETVATRAAFRRSFRRFRCLVLADGFYEWQAAGEPGQPKTPYWVALGSREPFAMAGIWASWRERDLFGERWLHSCAILTTGANAAVTAIHDRMPVILHPEAEDAWLDPGLDDQVERLKELLVPVPADALHAHPVSRRVNSVRNQGPDLIESVPSEGF
jgi:putative SOS response-associated peptidase YedK